VHDEKPRDLNASPNIMRWSNQEE